MWCDMAGWAQTHFETARSQMEIGGKANSRWLQVPDLDLFPRLSRIAEPCSV